MKNALFLMRLFPLILAAVEAVESVIQKDGAGASKKQLVLDVVQVAAQEGELIGQELGNSLIVRVAKLIDTIVASLNKGGIFVTSKSAA